MIQILSTWMQVIKSHFLKTQSADYGQPCACIQKRGVFRTAQLRLTPSHLWIAESDCQMDKDSGRPGGLSDPNPQFSADPPNPSST